MTATEPSRYGMTFHEERRDRFFWGAVREHLAVVPSFRAMRAGDYPDWPTYYPGGVSLTTFSVGASLRATF